MANYIMVLGALLQSLTDAAPLTSPKYKVTWKTFAFPLIGLAAFFIYIYIFNVDILEVMAKVQQINLSYYLMAALAVMLDTLFFTLTWDSLLRYVSVKISALKLLLFVWIGIFIDTMIPAESVSGEIARIYLVNRERDGTTGKATASIVAQRLIGMGINLVTLLIGVVLLFAESGFYGTPFFALILFLIAATLIFFALLMLLCVKERLTLRIIDILIRLGECVSRGRWKATTLRQEVVDAAKAFHGAMKEYAHAPKTIFMASLFQLASWALSLSVFYLTFLSLGYSQINWSAILVISSIFVAVKSVPVGIPFEVGLPEITLTTLFVMFKVPGDISATATVLIRLLTLWLRFFIGFLAQQWIGLRAAFTRVNGETSVVQS